ncbi:hypothetical protein EVAR_5965_1 [Eumeta japonica]|uniref:Uncharacterized protein n=1 Tax=Eumeta variegata TaxID=151549 RepID=A0A4C1TFS4_EUMVA|nr:hypothetical protein EVAR_5965_1 [Eumeta japonica]
MDPRGSRIRVARVKIARRARTGESVIRRQSSRLPRSALARVSALLTCSRPKDDRAPSIKNLRPRRLGSTSSNFRRAHKHTNHRRGGERPSWVGGRRRCGTLLESSKLTLNPDSGKSICYTALLYLRS